MEDCKINVLKNTGNSWSTTERNVKQQVKQVQPNETKSDDAETVYFLECLARNILKRPLVQRQRFLATFEKKHGEEVTDKIKLYISKEFNKRVAARNKIYDEAQALREKLK